uniref:EOG090X054E n=1 Tax=Lynceus sp. MCZ IZ 141354 TaxID=1930659 RepID=A0A9N6ZFT9_9CRUS|nr:EOG090X054E [Lynceus sp. MCZ IZ 141354]
MTDPFAVGLEKKAEGDLPSAVLLFEAATMKKQQDPLAWLMLGLSLAENEQDPKAIKAFEQVLKYEPGNSKALMGLAVSYTNEGFPLQACKALDGWLRNNPKYSTNLPPAVDDPQQNPLISSLLPAEMFMRVQNMYLNAARQDSSKIDAEVQCGLGVLLNLTGDYDRAVECFQAALAVCPDDALLWNRLGATSANGGRSEEAVQAYARALELSPGFIRARYNTAVACINLGAHREAAEHLVTALSLQASGRGLQGQEHRQVMSENIWGTLRTVLSLLGRQDLYADIDNKDIQRLAVEFGV